MATGLSGAAPFTQKLVHCQLIIVGDVLSLHRGVMRRSKRRVGHMEQIIRELKRQLAGEKLTPGQLKGLARVLSSTNFRAAAPQHLSRQILSPRTEKRSQSTETGSHSGRWPSSGCTSRSPSRGAGIGIITSAPGRCCRRRCGALRLAYVAALPAETCGHL